MTSNNLIIWHLIWQHMTQIRISPCIIYIYIRWFFSCFGPTFDPEAPARTSTPSRFAIGGRQRPSTIPVNFWPMEPMESWWQSGKNPLSMASRLSWESHLFFFLGDFQWLCLKTLEGDHWLILIPWHWFRNFFFWRGVLHPRVLTSYLCMQSFDDLFWQ